MIGRCMNTRRVAGSHQGMREWLPRRLADLDQQLAKVPDHLKALDAETAMSLGLYDEAKPLAGERKQVELALADLGRVLDGGTIEEKRELIRL